MTPDHVISHAEEAGRKCRVPFNLVLSRLLLFSVSYSTFTVAVGLKFPATTLPLNQRCQFIIPTMSFDRLSSLESQPTTTRRQDDPTYRDDPEFQRFTESLSTKLFELISNISRLSNQLSKKDTERGRERIHDLLEETRDGFKEVGDGVKRAQSWSDLNVSGTAFKR